MPVLVGANMPSKGDKYPTSNRRRFVKGVVGSAALTGGGAAATSALMSTVSSQGIGGGNVTYYGIKNTDGPAPRAMPMIPIEADDEGYLRGIWPGYEETEADDGSTIHRAKTQELGGIQYSPRWFQYCGIQGAGGLQHDYEGDNYLRYADGRRVYDWQPTEGRVHVDDFEDYSSWSNDIGTAGLGKPALATWRSQESEDTIPVHIIRSTRVEEEAGGDTEVGDWLEASTVNGFMVFLNKCTHYCCTPKFKSPQAAKFDATDEVYCGCHQSVYDPFQITKRSYAALPRPDN